MLVFALVVIPFARSARPAHLADSCVRTDGCSQATQCSQLHIHDCLFENCQADDNGGAIWGNSQIAIVTFADSQFISCHAGNDGGAIWYEGGDSIAIQNIAMDWCSAGRDSAAMHVCLGQESNNSVDINVSRGLGGVSNGRTIWPATYAGHVRPITITSLNSSFHQGTGWSLALDIGERSLAEVLFCRFHSCSPVNTFVVYTSDEITERYGCLEFYNNTVTAEAEHSRYAGLISINANCEFHDCIFVENTVTAIFVNDPTVYWHPGEIRYAHPHTVKLTRCVFDSESDLFSHSVIPEIQGCETAAPSPIALDPVLCAPIGRGHCGKTRCAAHCEREIVIADCMFVDCTDENEGGAIGIAKDNSVSFWLLRCQFYACSSAEKGGGVFFEGENCRIFAFTGVDCNSSRWGACCAVYIEGTETGVSELNESSSLRAFAPYATFVLEFQDRTATATTALTTKVNSSKNYLHEYGTGMSISSHHSALIQFCWFHSNAPGCVLYLHLSTAPDRVECVDFVNNSAYEVNLNSAVPACLIALKTSCTFRDCAFVANQLAALVRYIPPQGQAVPSVVFAMCWFDTEAVTSSVGVDVVHEDFTRYPADWILARASCPREPVKARATLTPTPVDPTGTFERTETLKPVDPTGTFERTETLKPVDPTLKPVDPTLKPVDPTGTFERTETLKLPAQTQAPPGAPKENGLGDGDGANSGSGSLWAGVGGAVAAIAVIAAVILTVLLKRRKQMTTVVEVEDDPEGTSTETGTWVDHADAEFVEEENPYASSGDAQAQDEGY
jgi:hypothetical protein